MKAENNTVTRSDTGNQTLGYVVMKNYLQSPIRRNGTDMRWPNLILSLAFIAATLGSPAGQSCCQHAVGQHGPAMACACCFCGGACHCHKCRCHKAPAGDSGNSLAVLPTPSTNLFLLALVPLVTTGALCDAGCPLPTSVFAPDGVSQCQALGLGLRAPPLT